MLPSALLGNGALLATFSERGGIEGLWAPHPDRRVEVTAPGIDGAPLRQEYVGSTQILRTTVGDVVVEDVVHDTEALLLRRITHPDGTVEVRSYPTATGEPFDDVVERRIRFDAERLAGTDGSPLYRRSLLVFDALSDRETGAVIAAPELDPDCIHSGGYGFVWARDLAFVVLAFLASKQYDLARRALLWFPCAQGSDGLWAQRHHTDGSVAPSWCAHQIDETGTVVFAYDAAWQELRDEALDAELWPSTRRAADFLVAILDDDGVPMSTADLWEEREGRHAYTTAAVAAGLRAAASSAARHEPALASGYADAADRAGAAIDRMFWSDEHGRYLRTLGDPTVDASLLGLAWPFHAVDPRSARMRSTAAAVKRKLGRAGGGICRYERDTYAGGNPWVLAALWLGLWHRQVGDAEGHKRAIAYAEGVATPLGLLAEQVTVNGEPAWVLPLAWSHAMFVLAVRPELEAIRSLERASASPVRVAAS